MFCHKLHGYIRNHQAWHWVLEDYASIILGKIGASEYKKLCWKIGSLFYQIRKVGTTSAYLCINFDFPDKSLVSLNATVQL